ncbi:unnamed protein product [Caenorhabditis angaria]|uniref:7TM GPCR serpentine receptor class x (Srx) domain-containing protein n=1 Tax=Caenorhabditis angaria TaxID=860376 RepID=A0A9P1IYE8_9PELO|nr:unnamed protein product [Caenorhabditis angaria]
MNDALRSEVLLTFDWKIENITYVGPYIYQKKIDGTYETDFNAVIMIMVLFLIIFSSILTMLISGIKCFYRINKLINVRDMQSVYNNKLQSQLFYALITQTMIPVILMHFPVTVLFISVLVDLNLGTLSDIIRITITLFPALDPIPTMFIIKSYRIAIKSMIKVVFVRPKNTSIN